MKEPKICFWDIETSFMETATFGLYDQNIPHHNIMHDWYIICAAWKLSDRKKIYAVSLLDDEKRFKKNRRDDYHVVKTLRDMLQDVDIIVGHNQNRFDIKKFNARLIYHDLDPLPEMISIDTLREIKKIASFSSHRLDYLGKHLGKGGKLDTSPNLWLRVLEGENEAIAEMVRYNKIDVKRLEELYYRIRKYIKRHPHIGAMRGKERTDSCPSCGSTNLFISKTRYTISGIKRTQKQCKTCHSYSTHTK